MIACPFCGKTGYGLRAYVVGESCPCCRKVEAVSADGWVQEGGKTASLDGFLYHNTTQQNLDSIRQEGLRSHYADEYPHGEQTIPDDVGRIYFSTDADQALSFGGRPDSRIPELRSLLLRVRVADLDPSQLVAPKTARGGETWYTGDIAPGQIEMQSNGRWVPLLSKRAVKTAARALPGSEFPLAGPTVDGRTVRSDVPNMSSIRASLNDYLVLKGIREVPMLEGGGYTAADDNRHSKQLAEQIRQSGEINPLIVVVDQDGPYILEGGHRFEALKLLGAKSFPAVVVVDNETLEKIAAIDGQVTNPFDMKPDTAFWLNHFSYYLAQWMGNSQTAYLEGVERMLGQCPELKAWLARHVNTGQYDQLYYGGRLEAGQTTEVGADWKRAGSVTQWSTRRKTAEWFAGIGGTGASWAGGVLVEASASPGQVLVDVDRFCQLVGQHKVEFDALVTDKDAREMFTGETFEGEVLVVGDPGGKVIDVQWFSKTATIQVDDASDLDDDIEFLVDNASDAFTVQEWLGVSYPIATQIEKLIQDGRAASRKQVRDLVEQVRGVVMASTFNRIPGGLAAGRSPADFDPVELRRGVGVEMPEHTIDPEIAAEIAADHLTEDPQYYLKHISKIAAVPFTVETQLDDETLKFAQAALDKYLTREVEMRPGLTEQHLTRRSEFALVGAERSSSGRWIEFDFEQRGIGGTPASAMWTKRPQKIYETPEDAVDTIAANPAYAYRGMSAEEYESIQATGTIQSHGGYNIGDAQKGLTFFAPEPDSARMYAGSFAPNPVKPTPDAPGYVIAVDKSLTVDHTQHAGVPEDELAIVGPVGHDQIRAVWKVVPDEYGTTNISFRYDTETGRVMDVGILGGGPRGFVVQKVAARKTALRHKQASWARLRSFFSVGNPLFHATTGVRAARIMQEGLQTAESTRGTGAQAGLSLSRNLDSLLTGNFGNYIFVLDGDRIRSRPLQYQGMPDEFEERTQNPTVPPEAVVGLILRYRPARYELAELSTWGKPVVCAKPGGGWALVQKTATAASFDPRRLVEQAYRFAQDRIGDDLDGYCLEASSLMARYLVQRGVAAELHRYEADPIGGHWTVSVTGHGEFDPTIGHWKDASDFGVGEGLHRVTDQSPHAGWDRETFGPDELDEFTDPYMESTAAVCPASAKLSAYRPGPGEAAARRRDKAQQAAREKLRSLDLDQADPEELCRLADVLNDMVGDGWMEEYAKGEDVYGEVRRYLAREKTAWRPGRYDRDPRERYKDNRLPEMLKLRYPHSTPNGLGGPEDWARSQENAHWREQAEALGLDPDAPENKRPRKNSKPRTEPIDQAVKDLIEFEPGDLDELDDAFDDTSFDFV